MSHPTMIPISPPWVYPRSDGVACRIVALHQSAVDTVEVSPLDSNRRCRTEWGEISRSLYSQESDRRTPPSTPALANYCDSPAKDTYKARVTTGRSGEGARKLERNFCSDFSHLSMKGRAGSSFIPGPMDGAAARGT